MRLAHAHNFVCFGRNTLARETKAATQAANERAQVAAVGVTPFSLCFPDDLGGVNFLVNQTLRGAEWGYAGHF